MQFRTDFDIPKPDFSLDLSSKLLTIGSCFAEVVGNQLKDNKLNVQVNPFGTLFSPLAIYNALELALGTKTLDERLFLENQGIHFHYDFHSSFSALTKSELHQKINFQIANCQLSTTNVIILTFGSAFVYRLQNPPTYIANCHKMPSQLFERDLLSVKDICKAFGQLYKALKSLNPSLHIILSVSPVRHTRDGIPQNSLSKSILRAACHYLATDFEGVSYFPSYEIMLDDLRDYRFYKPDLIHPNEVAEQYIFEKFTETYFNTELRTFVTQWQEIRKSLSHKPFNENSLAHQKFLETLLVKLREVANKVSVTGEIEEVEKKLMT